MIHQFWDGEMPENIARWVEKIRTVSGGRHRLWNWQQFAEKHPSKAAQMLAEARAKLPPAKWASLASDYIRFNLVAEEGGMYLDADTECTVEAWVTIETAMASLPDRLYGGRERYNPAFPNSCLYWASGENGRKLARKALEEAEKKLEEILKDEETLVRIANGKESLCDVIGPKWLRRTMGTDFRPLPEKIASSHNPESIFWHRGIGTWMQKEQTKMNRPAWLTPCGKSILPTERQGNGTATADTRHSPGTTAKNTFQLPLATLRQARRIIVFSNITQGFSLEDVSLQTGDLVCHCNRAVHYPKAKQKQGTKHWLFIRSGKCEQGRKWYTPEDFEGFDRVRFIDDGIHVHRQEWYKEYKVQGGTSPTTGFIVANTLHSLSPSKPLILAGFDPGTDHGTPLWHGHNWTLEKQWYTTRNFQTISPRLLKN